MSLGVRTDNSAPATAASPDGITFPLNIAGSPMPAGATALVNTSGVVSAATATATLTSTATQMAYLSGFEFQGFGATAATGRVAMTISGVIGGPLTYYVSVPSGVAVAVAPFPLAVVYDPPLPASAVNTNIVVSMPSLGAGNLVAVMTAHGYLI